MLANINRAMLCVALMSMAFASAARAEEAKPKAPEAAVKDTRAMVEKVQCVPLHMIRQTKVVDDQTILFEMNNGKVWRNELRYPCHGLKSENRFSYKTSLNQLCNTDIITVLPTMGIPGPSCGLGDFVRDQAEPPQTNKTKKSK